jgi:hypothetical protein
MDVMTVTNVTIFCLSKIICAGSKIPILSFELEYLINEA